MVPVVFLVFKFQFPHPCTTLLSTKALGYHYQTRENNEVGVPRNDFEVKYIIAVIGTDFKHFQGDILAFLGFGPGFRFLARYFPIDWAVVNQFLPSFTAHNSF
jgi:hypothetical protein